MHTRLKAARIKAGYKSGASAARRLTLSTSTYNAHENGQNEFGPEYAEAYGRVFKVSSGWLLTGEGHMEAPPSTASPSPEQVRIGGIGLLADEIRKRAAHALPPATMPLFASLTPGSDDYMDAPESYIDLIAAPPQLENTQNCYALRMPGPSMEPRYFEGETLYISPDIPRPGACALIQSIIFEGDEEKLIWQVGRYERADGKTRIFSRFNDDDLVIKNAAIKAMHKIVACVDW